MIATEHDYRAIAKAVGTPYYCYSAKDIRERFRGLVQSLPQGIRYLYSLKANPNKAIVEILRTLGAGCEVCSLTELEIALAAGVDPKDILFVGPAKSTEELKRCVQVGIWAIIVESLSELIFLEEIASSLGVVQTVGLRINPTFQTHAAKLVMSGKPTQFGIDDEDLLEALNLTRNCYHLRLIGIHVYLGTRILDVGAIVENTIRILELAERVEELASQRLEFVDVGGGFGVNYFKNESELELDLLGKEMASIVEHFRQRHPSTQMIIELGRYLVARSGVFVTSVRYIKRCKGKRFAICDGGSNCHAAAAGFNSLFRRNFPITRLNGASGRSALYTITGPLCTPTDIIGEDIPLDELQVGDLIGLFDSGAYGPTASPVHFLGFGYPAEVLIDDEDVRLIRKRTSVSDELANQETVLIELP